MSFLKYASGQAGVAVTKTGLYVTDGGLCTGDFNGERIEIRQDGARINMPLLKQDVNSLWSMYASNNKKNFDDMVRREAERYEESLDDDSDRPVYRDKNYLQTLGTILFEIAPYFIKRTPDDMENLLSKKKYDEKEAIFAYYEKFLGLKAHPEKTKGTAKETKISLASKDGFGSFFESTVANYLKKVRRDGIVILNNESYSITERRGSGNTVVIGGKKYSMLRSRDNSAVEHLDKAFDNYLRSNARNEGRKAAAEGLLKSTKFGDRENAIISEILGNGRRKNIDFGLWGINFKSNEEFSDIAGGITLYLNVPKHVLRDYLGYEEDVKDGIRSKMEYYLIQDMRVGIEIYKNLESSKPFMISLHGDSAEYHPFAQDSSGDCISICMGSYHLPGDLSKTERIAKHLLDAKKVVLTGYMRGIRPVNTLRGAGFRKISKSEIKKRKLQVTN